MRYSVKEIMEADSKGRLVILPCAIGDNAYIVRSAKDGHKWIVEVKVTGLHLFDNRKKRYNDEYLVVRNEAGLGLAQHISMRKVGTELFFSYEDAKEYIDSFDNSKV